jgi:NAD(P)-dependent dehydrogenase (short-subunit alcohol dehydrogenase family)
MDSTRTDSAVSNGIAGRVVVVTGAGRGLGREHALLLAARGARVVVNDLPPGPDGDDAASSVVREIVGAGGEAVVSHADVSEFAGGEGLIQAALGAFGRVDGLVNNAGLLRDAILANVSEEDWDLSVRVNLTGHLAPSRAAVRHWREESKAGRTGRRAIVNTSSESGVFANVGQTSYAAAKAAIASLTELWAKELGRYGVRVNAIMPRARTRLTEQMMPDAESIDGFDLWAPANVSPFVAYLLGDECELSGFNFLAAGGRIQWARPWSLDPEWLLDRNGRWTVEDVTTAACKLGVPDLTWRDSGVVA